MRRVVVSTGGLITLRCSPRLVLEWCDGLWCRRVVWSHSDAHLGLYWSDAAGCGVDGWSDHAQMLTWACIGVMRQVVVPMGGLITLWCSPRLVLEWCGRLWCRWVVWSHSDAHLGLFWSDAAGWGVDGWSNHALMLTWACIGVMRQVGVSTGGLITLWCSPGLVFSYKLRYIGRDGHLDQSEAYDIS